MKSLDQVKTDLLKNPKTRAEYGALGAEFETARELISARSLAGLTQGEVAQLMGTTQSVIARLESGKLAPSLRTVQRYARAVGVRAVLRIERTTT